MAEVPVSELTVDQVARAAGISRSSFYFHFAGLDDLLIGLAGQVAEDIRAAGVGLFTPSPGEDPAEALRLGIDGYLARWEEKGRVLRAMAVLAETDQDLRAFWTDLSDDLLRRAAAGIEDLRAAGVAAAGPPAAEDLARVLSAMLWRSGYEVSLDPPDAAGRARLVEALAVAVTRVVGVRMARTE